jgi:hypothetical protein
VARNFEAESPGQHVVANGCAVAPMVCPLLSARLACRVAGQDQFAAIWTK